MDPETVLIGDFNSKPAPRGGAVEYLNKSNPPYAPPNPVRRGHTIHRHIMRHLRLNGKPEIDFFKDSTFTELTCRMTIDAEMKRLKASGESSK